MFKWILLGIVISVVAFLLSRLVVHIVAFKKHWNEPKYCNKCEVAFLEGYDYYYEYCPYCGKKLDYYKSDVRSKDFDKSLSNKDV